MNGFDPKFTDFPHYILAITKEIWEDRNIASLNDYYAQAVIVRTPNGISVGNQNAIAATAATLNELPDRQLFGEDVIWCGDETEGFLSSHRIVTTAHHLGDGILGKATGTALKSRVLADCYAINNQISDEWLIRDASAFVRQLGWHPKEYAQNRIDAEGGFECCQKPLTPDSDQVGPYQGHGNDHPHGQQLADLLGRMMSAEFSIIPQHYDRAANVFYAGGVEEVGRAAADQFWLGLRASFPSADFNIHHVMGRDDPLMPPRAAVRWSLSGKHDGWGSFGSPSGADTYVMGITHGEFGPWGLRREYTLIDETAIYKQILLHQG